eukprot:Gb_31034 [translate_table: standard]
MATMELAMFPSSPFHNCAYHKSTNESHIHVGYVQHTTPASALQLNNVNTLPGETLLQEGLDEPGIPVDYNTYASLLQSCSNVEALKQTHVRMFRCGLYQNIFLETKLMNMYATFGSMENARLVFDKLYNPDVLLWNSIFRGYVKNGFYDETLAFYSLLQRSGIQPNNYTFSFVLKACAGLSALQEGKEIHGHIIRSGFELDAFVGTGLINMYCKCGRLEIARLVFDKMHVRDVVSWSAMVAGYAQAGHANEALALFHQMQQGNIIPNSITMVSVLRACAHLGALQQGIWLHGYIIRSGFESDVFVGNSLVAMYARCGKLLTARQVFDKMSERNVVSWNSMLTGYTQNGYVSEALALFRQMQLAGIEPDSATMVIMLPVCVELTALREGKCIHSHIIRNGFDADVLMESALIYMYAKCESLEIARQLFDKISNSNVQSWGVMIAGYAQGGHANEALKLFNQMLQADMRPDLATVVSVLPACAHLTALQQGKWIHSYSIRSGLEADDVVKSALTDMYVKCNRIECARQLFKKMSKRNVVTWNIMIAGYVHNGDANEALTLFNQMQLTGIQPDTTTMVSVLPACAHLAALHQGKSIHGYTIRSGFESNVLAGTALIDMYAKCGSIELARQVFEKISKKDVVLWSAMIARYAQSGHANEALALFAQMQVADIKPDAVTMVSVLQACAHLAALQQGKLIHGYIVRRGVESHPFMGTALIDMYAKCGSIETACKLFDAISERDEALWNAMIAGYGMHGDGRNALALFSQMQQTHVKPNHITFISVLSACSHAGLVDEGWEFFECMSRDYHIMPMLEHYACMIDLLGRAGHLDEAENFVQKMPFEPDSRVWGALLGACRIYGNIEIGERVGERLFDLEPENAGWYVLLSNIYSAAGRWDEAAKVRRMMKYRGLKKTPGCSLIEVNNRVHPFLVGDRSHPQSEKIYTMLEILAGQMKESGYVPDTNFVLHDVEEEVKEDMLGSHSEKLAIAYGLISSSHGTPIRITKNLRVCGDCHNATKFISKIVNREIIVRDSNRFHHFKDGMCSCGGYW